MLSHSSFHNESCEEISLNTSRKFWNYKDHYQTAKMAVAEIFNSTNDDLYSMSDRINRGEDNVITDTINKNNKGRR